MSRSSRGRVTAPSLREKDIGGEGKRDRQTIFPVGPRLPEEKKKREDGERERKAVDRLVVISGEPEPTRLTVQSAPQQPWQPPIYNTQWPRSMLRPTGWRPEAPRPVNVPGRPGASTLRRRLERGHAYVRGERHDRGASVLRESRFASLVVHFPRLAALLHVPRRPGVPRYPRHRQHRQAAHQAGADPQESHQQTDDTCQRPCHGHQSKVLSLCKWFFSY